MPRAISCARHNVIDDISITRSVFQTSEAFLWLETRSLLTYSGRTDSVCVAACVLTFALGELTFFSQRVKVTPQTTVVGIWFIVLENEWGIRKFTQLQFFMIGLCVWIAVCNFDQWAAPSHSMATKKDKWASHAGNQASFPGFCWV